MVSPNANSPLGQGECNVNMVTSNANSPLGRGEYNINMVMPYAYSPLSVASYSLTPDTGCHTLGQSLGCKSIWPQYQYRPWLVSLSFLGFFES